MKKNNKLSFIKSNKKPRSRLLSEVFFISLVALGLVYLTALLTYSPSENPWSGDVELTSPVINQAGIIGAYLGDVSLSILGYVSYFLPIALIWLGYNIHKNTEKLSAGRLVFSIRFFAFIALVAFTAAFLTQNTSDPAGGWIGQMMHDYFGVLFGSVSFIVYLSIMMISFSLASTASWVRIFTSTGGTLNTIFAKLVQIRANAKAKKSTKVVIASSKPITSKPSVMAKVKSAKIKPNKKIKPVASSNLFNTSALSGCLI